MSETDYEILGIHPYLEDLPLEADWLFHQSRDETGRCWTLTFDPAIAANLQKRRPKIGFVCAGHFLKVTA